MPFNRVENRKYLDTLRMTDSELAVVVSEELCRNSTERRHIRRPTNFMRMTIDITQPGGTTGKFIVRSYDLSEGGVGFFTGNYVHGATRCRLGITTIDGESLSIDGTIAHCRNVWGHVHFAGVQFDSPIDLSWFEPETATNAKNLETETTIKEGEQVRDLDPASLAEILAAINELRGMLSLEQQSDEVRACLTRLDALINPQESHDTNAQNSDSQNSDAQNAILQSGEEVNVKDEIINTDECAPVVMDSPAALDSPIPPPIAQTELAASERASI